MIAYKEYKVSEFLKDRLPFIEGKDEFVFDKHQISTSYNEKYVPHLKKLLDDKTLVPEKQAEALSTLNMLVSYQEAKETMIEEGLVTKSVILSSSPEKEVRHQSLSLLGSLLFIESGRKALNAHSACFEVLKNTILDKEAKIRKTAAWTVNRLALHKDGADILIKANCAETIVTAVNNYSTIAKYKENKDMLVYHAESLTNIAKYDYGTERLLSKGLLNTIKYILLDLNQAYSSESTAGEYLQLKLHLLSLVKNIILLRSGKEEAIDDGLIECISPFLRSSVEEERLYSSAFFMGLANNLEARKIILQVHEEPSIMAVLCTLLEDNSSDIRENAKWSLRILSDYPACFLCIVNLLRNKLELLNEVFAERAVKGLSELIPFVSVSRKLTDSQRGTLTENIQFVKGIDYFIKNTEGALDILVNETVDFNRKLAPFTLLEDKETKKMTRLILNKVATLDAYNAEILENFQKKHGI